MPTHDRPEENRRSRLANKTNYEKRFVLNSFRRNSASRPRLVAAAASNCGGRNEQKMIATAPNPAAMTTGGKIEITPISGGITLYGLVEERRPNSVTGGSSNPTGSRASRFNARRPEAGRPAADNDHIHRFRGSGTDTVKKIAQSMIPMVGIALSDITSKNDAQTFTSMKRAFGETGVPFFTTINRQRVQVDYTFYRDGWAAAGTRSARRRCGWLDGQHHLHRHGLHGRLH